MKETVLNAKRLCAVLVIVGLALLGGSAFAEIGTIDFVPAATMLLPYFEVDLDAPNSTAGLNTYFSINNASAAATIAHVVIWSDYTVPLLDFNVYLTGYDVQTINLYDIIALGNIPPTAEDNVDEPADAISNDGSGLGLPFPLEDPEDIEIDSCIGNLPINNPIPAILINRLRNGLTGKATTFDGGQCVGFNYGDNVARGYITIDNVNECTLLFPATPGYFGPGGVASDENQLWGDYFIVDAPNAFAIGESLVAIEAEDGLGQQAFYTFYGRFLGGSGADDREALGNVYATRYLKSNPLFTGGTDLLVWREANSTSPTSPFVCGSAPVPFPLNETAVVAFDEAENGVPLCTQGGSQVSPPTGGDDACFPLETQRVSIGTAPLNPPENFGWLYLDLDVPTLSPGPEEQAWVVTNISGLGVYSVGYDALQLNNLTFPPFGGTQPFPSIQ